jgi:hypothetical protein
MVSDVMPPGMNEEDYFRNFVPESLRKRFVRAVLDGCTSAYDDAQQRDKDFFVDAVPALRRLAVEPILSKLVLPNGFESEIIRTPSTNYTQISSDKIVITAVTRAEEVNFVEPYRYRETLARGRQRSFAFARDYEDQDNSHKLYALLVYGGPHSQRIPTVARFVFPNPQGDIISDGINLISDYANIVDSYRDGFDAGKGAEPSLRGKEEEDSGE